MSLTCACFDGKHGVCGGKVSKWAASRDDIVLDSHVLASDGVRVVSVACQCACHLHPSGNRLIDKIEGERLTLVREA